MPEGVLLTYTTLISNNSEHLDLPLLWLFCWVCVANLLRFPCLYIVHLVFLFVCLFVCLFALSSFCCSSAQCFQCLSIVHFRLPLRGSLALTFLIFTIRFFDEIVLCYHHWIPVISVSALVWLINIYIIEIYSP